MTLQVAEGNWHADEPRQSMREGREGLGSGNARRKVGVSASVRVSRLLGGSGRTCEASEGAVGAEAEGVHSRSGGESIAWWEWRAWARRRP